MCTERNKWRRTAPRRTSRGYRMIRWLRENVADWESLMVMLSGRSGRPTAGLTWASNSMCHLLWKASDERLSVERVYIAPHAPSLVLADIQHEDQLPKLSAEFREVWNNTRASVDLARHHALDRPRARLRLLSAGRRRDDARHNHRDGSGDHPDNLLRHTRPRGIRCRTSGRQLS
jgi:hypothetical protein